MKKLLYILFILSLGACSAPLDKEVQSEEAQSDAETETTISQAVAPLPDAIECYGILDLPPNAVHELFCKVEGYISGVQVQAGSKVQQGQELATVTSPEFSVWQKEYAAAKIEFEWQHKQYERSRKLFEEKAISDKEFQQAEKTYLMSKSEFNGIRNRLTLIGFTEAELENPASLKLSIKAPKSGVVSFVEAVNGQKISAASHLFTIINPNLYQLKMQVSAKDIAHVHSNTAFYFLHQGDTVRGHVVLINSMVEPDNTVLVYGKMEQPGGMQMISGQRVFVQILR